MSFIKSKSVSQDFWNPAPEFNTGFHSDEDFWYPSVSRGNPSKPMQSVWDFDDNAKPGFGIIDDWQPALLPWFDPARSDDPYVLDYSPPSTEEVAIRRGRWISFLLNIPDGRSRKRCIEFMTELFDRFSTQAAFKSLAEIALDGVTLDDFLAGCRFKLELVDHPYYAVRRQGRRFSLAAANPQSLLSWPRAVRFAELARGDPMSRIDEDWFEKWLALSSDHQAYWSFVDYIEWRLIAASNFYCVDVELARTNDENKFRSVFGIGMPHSRTGSLLKFDRGHIGALYPEKKSPKIALREKN